VLAYIGACWLVTSRRAVGGTVQSLLLLADRRSRPELKRVAGHTHHWLPLVESLDDRIQFSALERAVAAAREIGGRWQEQIPDDFPPIGTGLDVVAFERIEGEGVECEIVDVGGWTDDVPLTLRVVRADGRWYLDLACTGEPPEPLLSGWEHLVKIATVQPLSELALAAADVGDGGPLAAPDVVDAIERWQADRPDDVAIIDANGQLTVGELWRAAGELSARLAARTAVGIRCDRDHSFAIAALAVLRADAYFIPLTAGWEARHRDAGVCDVIVGDRIETPGTDKRQLSGDGKFAYAMWTSGSMGVPKLAMISRPTLAAATARVAEFVGVTETDRYLHLASFGFSSSIRQMFVPLTRRATVLLASEATRTNVAELLSWLGQVRPTIIDTTPTMLDAIAETECVWPQSVRAVLSASEQLTPSIVDRFRAATGYTGSLFHMYGTTETSGLVAGSVVGAESSRFSLAPLPGCRLYIRDAYLHPVPVGMVGELYVDVGGGSDAYADPRGTAAAFVPSSRTAVARMFRTRDRARCAPDGGFEWLGRYDDLIKIRAERVSLTSVAEMAQSHPAVGRALAIDMQGEVGIAVAVVRGAQLSVEGLQEHMRGQGLHAELPTRVAIVDRLPQNASGKIDRRAVRDLITRSGDQRAPVVAAATPTERALAELWAAVLPDRTIGVTDNFFDLGGHSLKAARLAARVRREISCDEVGVATVFDHPTIRTMAAFMDSRKVDR